MDQSDIDRHIAEYSLKREIYVDFTYRLKSLIESLMGEASVDFHIVDSRAKSVESFGEKIQRSGKNYSDPIKEMPDLCGCRIILYYADDITAVANLLKSEFDLIEEELSHLPDLKDSDRFGYVSAHYILKLSEQRKSLIEWKKFCEIHFEVQLRTVIQHAWSSVSHAVQYKQESQTPSMLRRKLHRIAGLFELADEQFIDIRNEKLRRDKDAEEAIKKGDKDIEVNPSSVEQFLLSWDEKKAFSKKLMGAGFSVAKDEMEADVPYHISYLSEIFDLKTISEIKEFVSNFDVGELSKVRENYRPSWRIDVEFGIVLALLSALKDRVGDEILEALDWDSASRPQLITALNSN